MKKLILTLIAIAFTTMSFAQTEVNKCIVTLNGSTDLKMKNDTLTVEFSPSEYFWSLDIKNNLKKDISVVWDKSSFVTNGKASKVVFATTTILTKDNLIQNEEIPTGSYIIRKVFPVDHLISSGLFPTINKKTIKSRFEKEATPDVRKIVLAVIIDNEIKKFEYNFSIVPKLKN